MERVFDSVVVLPLTREQREDRFIGVMTAERHRAFGLALRLVGGDRSAAEDVLQDAMLKAFNRLGTLKNPERLTGWFFQILVREAHSFTRRRKLGRQVREFLRGTPKEAAVVDLDPGLNRRINAALGELSSAQREAFVLVYGSGFTIKEAAEILGKAPGTVKVHLHRAVRGLRASLKDIAEGELT